MAELQPNPSTNWEETAQRFADDRMKQADAEGMDNNTPTWVVVRHAKGDRKGENFMPFGPYQISRWFK